jgi:hypothetical protein
MLFAVGYPGGPWALERSLEVGPSDGFLTGTRGPAQLGKRFCVDIPAHRTTKDFCHPREQIKNGNSSELATSHLNLRL